MMTSLDKKLLFFQILGPHPAKINSIKEQIIKATNWGLLKCWIKGCLDETGKTD